MALVYKARLSPSKSELLNSWVPDQPWTAGVDTSTLEVFGAYRFDDPDGEVGIETHLLRSGDGYVLQVPLTYRGAPSDEAEPSLITTMSHSELGTRWIYDACGDPVYARALAKAAFTGGSQAELDVVTDSGPQRSEPTVRVAGNGSPDTPVPSITSVTPATDGNATVLRAPGVELVVLRVIEEGTAREAGSDSYTVTGTWPGCDTPTPLAHARPG